jgi:hypothetical protein
MYVGSVVRQRGLADILATTNSLAQVPPRAIGAIDVAEVLINNIVPTALLSGVERAGDGVAGRRRWCWLWLTLCRAKATPFNPAHRTAPLLSPRPTFLTSLTAPPNFSPSSTKTTANS